MTQKTSTNLVFKQMYTFPESVENHIWEMMQEYTQKVGHKTYWLHAPAGISRLGSIEPYIDDNIVVVSFDIDPKVEPDIIGDIYNLSHEPLIWDYLQQTGVEKFDGVISDPIWIEQKRARCRNCKEMTAYKNPKGVQYHKRRYISYELRDVLKSGGIFIMNCLWNPWVKGLSKIPVVGVQTDYAEHDDLENIQTVETIYQAFSSFRNVSLIWRFSKE